MTLILTPQEKKEKLKKRLSKVLKNIPERWTGAFVFLFPEYSKQVNHLNNVGRGLSLDEDVIEKMEQLAEKLKTKK